MNKLLCVLRHEYLSNVLRRAFLFAALGVPLLIALIGGLIVFVALDTELNLDRVGRIGYIDEAGVLTPSVEPPPQFQIFSSAAAARAALDSGEIGAYFVILPDYMTSGAVRMYSTAGFPEALKEAAAGFLTANLGARLDDPLLATRASEPFNLLVHTLDTDRTLEEGAIIALIFTPLLLIFVLMFAIQLSSTYLMSGVVEEKANRVMEMLITSVTPFQLLLGKILGLGLLGLTQVAIWLAVALAGWFALQRTGAISGVSLPLDIILIGLAYFVFAYLLYGSLLASLGAVIGSEQESRQYAGILMIVPGIPFFLLIVFILDPNGALPTALSFIPFTAPTAMIMRAAFTAVPAWQIGASLAGVIVTTVLTVWISARIFRWSLLRYGKKPRLRDLFRRRVVEERAS